MRRKFVGFLFQVESLGLCWLPTPGGTSPRSLESGSAHQIPEVLPLKDGKICPNAATSAVFYHGLLNYGSFGCDVSDRKGKMGPPGFSPRGGGRGGGDRGRGRGGFSPGGRGRGGPGGRGGRGTPRGRGGRGGGRGGRGGMGGGKKVVVEPHRY